MAMLHQAAARPPEPAPVLRRDWVGTAFWGVSFGAASCFLALVALLAALA